MSIAEPPVRPGLRRQLIHTATAMAAILAVLLTIAVISSRANANKGLRADILGPRAAEPGETVEYVIAVRDTRGVLRTAAIDFGDGKRATLGEGEEFACHDGAEGAFATRLPVEHVYPRQGVYTARIDVVSGGCGAREERVSAVRTIQVKIPSYKR